MNSMNDMMCRFSSLWLICAVGIAGSLWCGAGAHAAVTAEPKAVLFNSMESSVTVKLLKDGAPMPAAEIRGWRLMASGHAYNHMLKLVKADGAITISPGQMEVGSYDLVIDTSAGQVIVQVLAPLTDMADTLEKQAQVLGITVDELKQRMGLVKPLAHGREVRLELPETYYEGQTLELTMPLEADLVYVWKVNGEVVKQGPGENVFSYTFAKPGDYSVEYEERADNAVLAKASAKTAVKTLDPVQVKIKATQEQKFDGPDGYRAYAWALDGKLQSKEKNFKFRFMAPGAYKVECTATQPESGAAGGFLRQYYEVVVSSTK